jgi:hypothetical protein
MQRPRIYLAALALALSLTATAEKSRKPTEPLLAQQYPMHDQHTQEHVTIAAEPGDTFGHDMLPVRVIVTNDSDFALTLDDARIHLITGDNTNLPAATDDELQRRLFTLKSATGSKIPLPLPIPVPITHGKSNIDKKILADDNDFGFKTTTVKPHTTVAGYLYYDIQGLEKPLDHATLELRKVRVAETNKALDSFEIPLHPADPTTK